jgi:hypothetical protein
MHKNQFKIKLLVAAMTALFSGAALSQVVTADAVIVDDGAGQSVFIDPTGIILSGAGSVAFGSNGAMTASGNVNSNTLTVDTNATVGGTLGVAGASTLTGNLTASGNVNTIGNAAAANTLTGSTTISNGTRSMVVDATSARMVQGANNVTVNGSGVAMNGNNAVSTLNGANASFVNNTGHGIVVSGTQTVLSGGTSSTTLTLDDSGATFANSATGAPVRVSGIAAGTGPTDMVNYSQLQNSEKMLSRGIAATSAIANIPQVDQDKTFSIGAGVGGYNGSTAIALGGSYRVAPNAVLKASVAGGTGGKPVVGMGGAFSW